MRENSCTVISTQAGLMCFWMHLQFQGAAKDTPLRLGSISFIFRQFSALVLPNIKILLKCDLFSGQCNY